jgi:hypothetical protein
MANSKKKKHVSLAEQQKLQQAQYKNLFKEKLMHVCELIEDVSLYYLIPPADREKIYRLRGAPLKIKAARGAKIQKRLLEVLEHTIRQILLQQTIEIIPGSDRRIGIGDYFSVCAALENVLSGDRCTFPGAERFRRFLKTTDYREEQYNEVIHDACQLVCNVYDDLSQKRLYTYTTKLDTACSYVDQKLETSKYIKNRQMLLKHFQEFDFRVHHDILIDTLPLDVRHVTIDRERRPAVQLGVVLYPKNSNPHLHCFTIPLEQLNVQNQFGKLSVPVYVQQHAMIRMMERTGIHIPGYCVITMQISFAEPVILPIANNRFLIEYHLDGLKAGYFLAELKDGILVLRTFLFLTNSGTPEGDKLAKLTRLQKKDREYLAIDNLRSLANSDILENETLCRLFREAGCESILQMCEKRKENPSSMYMIGLEEQKTSLSELVNEYLKPDADNEEYVVGE